MRENAPVTVFQLIAPTHFGGAERVVLGLVESLNTKLFRVVVGAFVNARIPGNEFLVRLEKAGIPHKVFWLSRTVDLENVFRMVSFVKREGIRLIHSHGYRSDIIGLAAARMSRLPIVSTVHGWVATNSRLKFYERCDRAALRFFNRVIPVSDQIADALAASGVNREKITRLHNAIPVYADSEKRDVHRGLEGKDSVLIGIIGRLSPEKDISSFLHAARIVADKFNKAQFMVVGDGPERGRLEQMTGDLGLNDRVTFTGFIEDMDAIYKSLDILVISSLTEGIPLVVLEAMEKGIPVVSTRVGGIPEVIEHGVHGLLVEPGNTHGLSRAIETLILDDNKYVEIVRNGRERMTRFFNRSIWTQEMERIYHTVLHEEERLAWLN